MNAYEALWKNMLHVAPQELGGRECHQALFVSACIVLPTESDLFLIKRNEPVIADRDAMGIAAQIAEGRCWTSHRLLDIDDPAFPTQRLNKRPECLGIFQRPGGAAQAEFVSAVCPFQSVEKLATKDFLENTERNKEAIPRCYPVAAIGERPPTGTRQWMCGWRSRFWPPLCRMARNGSGREGAWDRLLLPAAFLKRSGIASCRVMRDCAETAGSTRGAM